MSGVRNLKKQVRNALHFLLKVL